MSSGDTAPATAASGSPSEGRTAIVCGASSGLGRAVAAAFLEMGLNVVGTGRRESAPPPGAGLPTAWTYVPADLFDPASPAALIEAARGAYPTVDVLVLNSGGPPPGPAASLEEATLERHFRPMLGAMVELTRLALSGMLERGWGRIIAIGSSGVHEPIPDLVVSNVLRAGLRAYLKTLASEAAPRGVTVNMVTPGRIDTDRVRTLDAAKAAAESIDVDAVTARSRASIPAGRYGDVAEFAAVVAFLASDAASYITGESIRVDGGMARGH